MSNRKIAIKNLAILQTGDLAAILRYRTIFAPHRIDEHTAHRTNCPLPRLAGNLQVSPKIKVYFWVKDFSWIASLKCVINGCIKRANCVE